MTDRLRAVSVGCGVPRLGFEGAVHSVFENAANVQLARAGLLVTLICADLDLPQGIRLEPSGTFSFATMPIGATAICTNEVLRVGEALEIELRCARSWECDLASLNADVGRSEVATAWRTASRALSETSRHLGSATVGLGPAEYGPAPHAEIHRRLESSMSQMVATARQYDLSRAGALGELVGLGTGLTPSGDDLLVGFVAGLWCVARQRAERLRFLDSLGLLIAASAGRTSDISRTYLLHAARGQVSSRLMDLAAAICAGAEPARVVASTEVAASIGHTSGMETVNGLLLGLAAWDGAHLVA